SPASSGGGYLVLAELSSLVTAATGLSIWVGSLIEGRFDIAPASVGLVWGAVLAFHHRMAGRAGRLAHGVLAGSLIGVVSNAVFGVLFLARLLEWGYDAIAGAVVLIRDIGTLLEALTGLVVGAPSGCATGGCWGSAVNVPPCGGPTYCCPEWSAGCSPPSPGSGTSPT
ncbi:MAG: hypothetical protein OXF41_20845, partial [bacterium]|nr:hypothetical protein [bacterium]